MVPARIGLAPEAVALSWTVKAGLAALLISTVYMRPAPDQIMRPPERKLVSASVLPRLQLPEPLLGGPVPATRILNIRRKMTYGDFVWAADDGDRGPIWIRVDRAKQMLSVYQGGTEIGTAVILYGAEEKPTPPGQFFILSKHADYRSKSYDAEMPFSLRLTHDGIFIHGSDVRYGRATHGCIGLPSSFAKLVFERVGIGTHVVIL
jgi:hypothetical protein